MQEPWQGPALLLAAAVAFYYWVEVASEGFESSLVLMVVVEVEGA